VECIDEDNRTQHQLQKQTSIKELFAQAIDIDEKMKVPESLWSRLARKQVKTVDYDKELWFRNMADGKASHFHNFPVPAVNTGRAKPLTLDEANVRLVKALKAWRSQHKYRFRTGRSGSLKYLTVRELMKLWCNPRAIITTTDLHIRETPMEKVIDVKALGEFNLLPLMHEETGSLEMMSLIISSARALTDSHSDDLDISNYCFCGSKLWLAWDTQEGLQNGLDDRDRVPIGDSARFDMKTYLSLKSARWFLVDDGNMMYLPGNMAHRVVTLKPYIGVGAFYIAFPNALRTVSRWQQYTANWELDKEPEDIEYCSREEVASFVAAKFKSGSKSLKNKAGADYSGYALNAWVKAYSQSKRTKWTSATHIADAYNSSP